MITREPLDRTVLGCLSVRADAAIVNQQGQQADPEVEIVVNNWHCRYKQFTNSRCGIPIESSDDVRNHNLVLAADLINTIMSASPRIALTMISLGARVATYGPHEDVYDIPEHRGDARIMDRPMEGYGGMIGDPVISIFAANIERITDGMHQTRYPNESYWPVNSATPSTAGHQPSGRSESGPSNPSRLQPCAESWFLAAYLPDRQHRRVRRHTDLHVVQRHGRERRRRLGRDPRPAQPGMSCTNTTRSATTCLRTYIRRPLCPTLGTPM